MCFVSIVWFFFFFKQKTAYEMRISDWSSDVCSSDLNPPYARAGALRGRTRRANGAGAGEWRPLPPRAGTGEDRRARPLGAPSPRRRRDPSRRWRDAEREIGRASCRERSVRVDLGGRRIIKKKKQTRTNHTTRTVYHSSPT